MSVFYRNWKGGQKKQEAKDPPKAAAAVVPPPATAASAPAPAPAPGSASGSSSSGATTSSTASCGTSEIENQSGPRKGSVTWALDSVAADRGSDNFGTSLSWGPDLPPIEPAEPIADDDDQEAEYQEYDSDEEADDASSTESIASSILRYRVINGRTYHSDRGNAAYWGANDGMAIKSLDIHHHLMTLAMGGRLFFAPLEVDKITRIMDVGTGTGVWAMDFAQRLPHVEVTGTDISPIQPSWVPPNVVFEIEDCTQTWSWPDDTFDFVHMRALFGSIGDWEALFREAFRVCKPGGWVESYECYPVFESEDDTIPPKSAMVQFGKFYIEGGNKVGRTVEVIPLDLQRRSMVAAGLGDLGVWEFNAPIGGWPTDPHLRDIGHYSQATLEADMGGFVSLFANLLRGWSRKEVSAYCKSLRRELRNTRIHSHYRQKAVWGRKPLPGQSKAGPPPEAGRPTA